MMLDPTKIEDWANRDVKERYLDLLVSALDDGLKAARNVTQGGPADADALDEYAQALAAMRVGIAHKLLCSSGFLDPTEEDVRNAHDLAQLARRGASSEALVEPARRAARVMTDGWDLERFQSALFCLEDEASRVHHLDRIYEVLDLTIDLFERGCRASSFVSTPADVASVRRLREIAAAEEAETQAERMRLVRDLEARLPVIGSVVERETAVESLYLER